MPKLKAIKVAIEDAWRLKGRRPPSQLNPYFTLDEWTDLCVDIHNAIHPVIVLKKVVVSILTGLFAIPLLSFIFLLIFVLSGLVTIEDIEEDWIQGDDMYYDDAYDGGSVTEAQEQAFQLLLLTAACGCVGLAILCLIVGSAARNCYYQGVVEDDLTEIILEFEKNREDVNDGVAIVMEISQSEREGCISGCRQAFFSWCDLDFDFRLTIRDNFGGDYKRLKESKTDYKRTKESKTGRSDKTPVGDEA